MLFWIVRQSILSFVFIWIVHYLYSYFTDNLTVPKIKDLVHKPRRQYENMYKVIEGTQEKKNAEMKDNLKSYLSTLQKGNKGGNGSPEQPLPQNNGDLQYVPY